MGTSRRLSDAAAASQRNMSRRWSISSWCTEDEPDEEDIEVLREDPSLAPQFDEVFGPGQAALYIPPWLAEGPLSPNYKRKTPLHTTPVHTNPSNAAPKAPEGSLDPLKRLLKSRGLASSEVECCKSMNALSLMGVQGEALSQAEWEQHSKSTTDLKKAASNELVARVTADLKACSEVFTSPNELHQLWEVLREVEGKLQARQQLEAQSEG